MNVDVDILWLLPEGARFAGDEGDALTCLKMGALS
jgi:hypothetical protein